MIFRNAMVWTQNGFVKQDAILDGGVLSFSVSQNASVSVPEMPVFSNCLILPGFCDVHVHLREPGFCYKETVASGTASAARGGFTAVCSMPNLNPVPDSKEHLQVQLNAIKKDAKVAVCPYGALTVRQMGAVIADLDGMARDAIAFSDDGKGIQDENMMRDLMLRAKRLGKMVVAHCEDNALLCGGYIHDGVYSKEHNHRGICSESEWGPIARDLKLAKETGCAYHVCHISTKESVDLIRAAKAEGVDVTCETAPHYLVLCDGDLQEEGRFKMNPPLRSSADRDALIEGILDGTIDMIATDHAPHSAEEKSRGLEKSAFGIVGLETAFPIMYTGFVKTGKMTLERLVELMCLNPRRRFGITSDAGYTVWNVEKEYTVNPDEFASMGHATPFAGRHVFGENLLTVYNGSVVYRKNEEE